jgi:hypothetical protein
MFDIAFISYNESNADANWERLKNRFPFARRIHGVKGIHNAHINAANNCFTTRFWVVDGDSEIAEDFNFQTPELDLEDIVCVYRAVNPLNGLAYGNGGVKLLPRIATAALDVNSIDMTTSISKHFMAIDQVASITRFNTDPFNTWKSAFRECVKLSSKSIDRQVNTETEQRLDTWCTIANGDYSEYSIDGAVLGRKYGTLNSGNTEAIKLINDFDWLKNYFNR